LQLNRASQSVPDLLPLGCFFMTSTPSANDCVNAAGAFDYDFKTGVLARSRSMLGSSTLPPSE
jgi:hypothetical protein